MKKSLILLSLAGIASLGLAASSYAEKPAKPAAPVATPIGAPISCVYSRDIDSTHAINDSTIIFTMRGGKVYHNVLPYSCPGLRSEDRFSYNTHGSQLCDIDIIHVLNNYGDGLQAGAACGLGKFQQVEKPKRG